ncbi:hypothetical protein [uncultured Mediterranea sp.]|uniref:hypothetical protein n=1 Tax=uncultured Mediterranea sp. TaxID=1926662 RepID=UPI0027D992EE|nr:hypothetical protein [uncultured Mediterranea sp.]
MKKFKIQNVSGTALLVMLLLSVVVVAMFFLGGETPMEQRLVADTSLSEPAQTDLLIYWMYILFGVTVAVTLVAALYQLVTGFIDSPKTTLKSLLGVVLLVVIMIVSWAIGSGEPLVMPGYEGTENVPFWLKLTDMFLYTIYILMGITVLLIVGFGITKKFK